MVRGCEGEGGDGSALGCGEGAGGGEVVEGGCWIRFSCVKGPVICCMLALSVCERREHTIAKAIDDKNRVAFVGSL